MSLPVTYYNRRTQLIETETIYGEKFLRWAYETPLGRISLLAAGEARDFLPLVWLAHEPSREPGKNRAVHRELQDPRGRTGGDSEDFPHFNAFFSRKLKPAARPIAPEKNAAIFPADGRHFAIPDLAENDGIFVKGVRFDLRALLGDDALTSCYARGAMLISRLCPVDYHRFHFPCEGVPATRA